MKIKRTNYGEKKNVLAYFFLVNLYLAAQSCTLLVFEFIEIVFNGPFTL